VNQSELLDTIQNRLRSNQANYQPVVLSCLIKNNNSMKSIQNELAKANNKTDAKPYGKSCPVWKVLKNKGLIEINQDQIKLLVKVDKLQKPILKALKEKC